MPALLSSFLARLLLLGPTARLLLLGLWASDTVGVVALRSGSYTMVLIGVDELIGVDQRRFRLPYSHQSRKQNLNLNTQNHAMVTKWPDMA